MLELLSASIEKILDITQTLGYSGVFFLSLLDRLTIFLIPGELILPVFGILIGRGVFDFWPVFVLVTIGSFLGNLILYFIFLKGGRSFLEKYGRYFFISKHELKHLDDWFSRYGDRIVIVGYLLPTSIRSLVPIPAGISKMKLFRFSFYTLIASFPYNFILIYAGMKAGDRFKNLLKSFDRFNYIGVAVMLILVIWYIIRHMKRKHLTHE